MKIEDVLNEPDIAKRVEFLKKERKSDLPEIDKFKKQWNPAEHEIFNLVDRPDKTVYTEILNAQGDGNGIYASRIEKVARIPMSLQKLIVKRAVSFLFGNPVKTISNNDESKVADAVDRVLRDNKQDSLNRKVATILFSTTEVAEYWYTTKADEKFSTYGFETDVKIKCAVFSPFKGDILYPFFSETGDLIAFSREYKNREDDKEVTYFETWTTKNYVRLKQQDGGWVINNEKASQLGKIPIVYGRQESVEWADVQYLIERIEKLVSNFGDTNDYHGSPKIAVQGKVEGFSKKGESGGILELSDGATATYLAWAQAPESIKLEFENLLRMIFSLTQTPDISFDAVKGLGAAASGQSLKMLFLDAHLKVMDKMEIFDDYLQRRLNILKAIIGIMEKNKLKADADSLELSPVIIPYMVDDEKSKIDNLGTAVSVGIMSKQSAVAKNPLVEDAKEEMKLIEGEQEVLETSANGLDKLQNEPV